MRSAILLAAITIGLAGCKASNGPVAHPPVVAATPSPAAMRPDQMPAFTGYVVDRANLLTPAERARLTALLGDFQRQTAHQMAIVTVPSTGGAPIADSALRLASRWGLGRRGVDDGILILVTLQDHLIRIEVGRGLEHALSDRVCQEVIDDEMQPAFRSGHVAGGLEAGSRALMQRMAAAGA